MSTASEITLESRPDYLLVRLTGPLQLESAKRHFTVVIDACRKHGFAKVLLDTRLQTGAISIAERYRLAEHLLAVWPPQIRLAVVAAPEQSLPDRFGENVVVNRGLIAKWFVDWDKAVEWLGA
jgi:hypothetical protein